jgi:hypothetical protein
MLPGPKFRAQSFGSKENFFLGCTVNLQEWMDPRPVRSKASEPGRGAV